MIVVQLFVTTRFARLTKKKYGGLVNIKKNR